MDHICGRYVKVEGEERERLHLYYNGQRIEGVTLEYGRDVQASGLILHLFAGKEISRRHREEYAGEVYSLFPKYSSFNISRHDVMSWVESRKEIA